MNYMCHNVATEISLRFIRGAGEFALFRHENNGGGDLALGILSLKIKFYSISKTHENLDVT